MKTASSFFAPFLLAVAFTLSGCVTSQEVTAIVSQSNAAMLAGQFGLPAPSPKAGVEPWQEASERIETFIAAHPGQPAATAPLRVRQAMLLLGYRQYNLARAAFAQASLNDLHAARDQALKQNADTLVWWFASSAKDSWTADDQAKATTALEQLARTQAGLAGSDDIRDYLAEMRAWIGLVSAKQSSSTAQSRARLEDALNGYAQIFTPEDLAIVAAGSEQLPDPAALGAAVKRRLRCKAVLDYARQVNRENTLEARPANEFFRRAIN